MLRCLALTLLVSVSAAPIPSSSSSCDVCTVSGLFFKFGDHNGAKQELSFATLKTDLFGNFMPDEETKYQESEAFDPDLGTAHHMCWDGTHMYGNLGYFHPPGGGYGLVQFDVSTGAVTAFLNSSDFLPEGYSTTSFMLECSPKEPGVLYLPIVASYTGPTTFIRVDFATKAVTDLAQVPHANGIWIGGGGLDLTKGVLYAARWVHADEDSLLTNLTMFTIPIKTENNGAVPVASGVHVKVDSYMEMYALAFDSQNGVLVGGFANTTEQQYTWKPAHVDPATGSVTYLSNPNYRMNDGVSWADAHGRVYTTYVHTDSQMRNLLVIDGMSGETVCDKQIGNGPDSDWTYVAATCTN